MSLEVGPIVAKAYAGDQEAIQTLWSMCGEVTEKRRCQWPGSREEKEDFQSELYLKFRMVLVNQKFKGLDERFPAFWNIVSWNFLRDHAEKTNRRLKRQVRLLGDHSDDDFLGKHAPAARTRLWEIAILEVEERIYKEQIEESTKNAPENGFYLG